MARDLQQQRVEAYLRRLDHQRRDLAAEVEPDVAPFRDMSPDERGEILASVCRSAWEIMRSRSDFETAVNWRDPRSPESLATWQRLVAQHSSRHGCD